MVRLPFAAAARACLWLAAVACALPAVAVAREDAGGLAARLEAARDAIGVDPQRARQDIDRLRREAIAQGRLELRLAADEIECRLLTDVDARAALGVADAGLAAARAASGPVAPLPLLRLRACRASMQSVLGDNAEAGAEFDAVIAEAADPALAPARGIGLLERGVVRSRRGDISAGQADLLAACELLKPRRDDLELCLAHLANHYRRLGDFDEALALVTRLLDSARRRGATFDESVYGTMHAQVLALRGDHERAIASFVDGARLAERIQDRAGVMYAEFGIGGSLVYLRRPAEGLQHLERALVLEAEVGDPGQRLRIELMRAQALNGLDRAGEAAQLLARLENGVRARGEREMLADWLLASAESARRLGRWREAWQSLDAWRSADRAIQNERHSQQSARLRMQFNRERDAQEMESLRRLNEQGDRLRTTQAVVLALALLLLGVLGALAAHRLRRERAMRVLASTDELTGLPNRRAVLAHAEAALQETRRVREPLAVLMVDVDHFKRINDRHGHARGDEVLRHIARVLPSGLRHRDRLGRLGGEEFLAVLPGANGQQAGIVAERMREAIAATPLIGSTGELRFTVSIGVADCRAGEGVAALIERADAALYAAKEAGRNAVVHAPGDDRAQG